MKSRTKLNLKNQRLSSNLEGRKSKKVNFCKGNACKRHSNPNIKRGKTEYYVLPTPSDFPPPKK